MKKAKLLSLFLAGSLLFHTAGADALAVAASEPVTAGISAEEPENGSTEGNSDESAPEQSSAEDEEPSGNENPDQSSAEDIENKEPSGEEETSGQPSTEDGENKGPSESGASDQPSTEEEETKEPPESGSPDQPSTEEEENNAPAGDGETSDQPPTEEEETKEPSEEEETKEPSEEEEPTDRELSSENTVSENTISENTLPEENTGEDVFDIFPGLGDSYTMSSQQMADKRVLASHMTDIVKINAKSADDYPDTEGIYELGEVVYLADTRAEAEQVAKAFGGALDSYSYEVATISLPEKATVAMAVAASADPDIKLPAVWPNYYNYLDSGTNEGNTVSAPGDPGFTNQWQHDYIGTRYAWAAGFKGEGIRVAVIDTGLQQNHEDLSQNAVAGRNFVNGAAGTEYNVDNDSHGTHVAGIIAADDNGKGGVGIAPDATVRGYCVFPENGGANTSDVLRAINAAVEDGNDIINMSLGSPMYDDNYAKVVKAACDKGVAIFASSGNDDTDGNNFPASYPSTISVGAVDQNSARANFSNYGSTVNLSFPGVGIYSTLPTGYGYMSGTSQASPAAAGTAAVILSANETIRKKTGKARVDALLSAMKSSTTKCSNSGMGAGTTWLPGVLKIATDATTPDTPLITISETPKSGNTYIAETVTVTLSSATAVGVEIYYTTDGKNPAYKSGAVTNGEKYTGPFTVGGARNKTIKAIALNPVTGKVSKVASKSCVLTPAPTGATLAAANNVSRIAAGKSLKLTAAVTPAYAISTKVSWSVDAAAKAAGITVSNGTVKTKATTPEGEYTVTATVIGYDNVKADYKFTVIKTADVKKVAFLNNGKTLKAQSLNTGAVLNLVSHLTVTKVDNTELKGDAAAGIVVWSSSNPKIASVNDKGVVTAVAPGKATIKATSNDGGNKSASCTVTVKQPVTKITLGGPQKVASGKGVTLTAKVEPANATSKKLTWKVEGNDKVTISAKGKVTAKKGATGTCTVKATAADGSGISSDAYTVTILSGEITKITLSAKSLTLFSPQSAIKDAAKAPTTKDLTATVEGKTGFDKTLITWSSSAPAIASVDDTGKITAKTAGKATITCAATDGSNKKAICTVNVTIPMSKLAIGPTDSYGYWNNSKYYGYIAAGKSIKMSARYSSNYGVPTNKKVTWSSSNPDILKIDANGKVTANKNAVGEKAVITATAADGSGVTSNEYTISVTPLFQKLTIENGFVAVAWTADGTGYTVPYFTVSVSGGKNPGLQKQYDTSDECYYFIPIPGKVTTNRSSASTILPTSELQKMTMTAKLRDGSGLSAKSSIYVALFSDGKIKFFK